MSKIFVYAEVADGSVADCSLELVGRARELAGRSSFYGATAYVQLP